MNDPAPARRRDDRSDLPRIAIAAALLFAVACRSDGPATAVRSAASAAPAAGTGSGRLHVLLGSAPPAAADVAFRIRELSVVGPKGESRAIFAGPGPSLSIARLAESPEEIVAAELEEGLYRGFRVRFESAERIDGPESRTPIAVDGGLVAIDTAVSVSAGRDATVVLLIDASDASRGDSRFSPEFGARTPERRPQRSLLLVALEGTPAVLGLDRRTGERVETLATAGPPGGIAVASNRQRLFVAEPEKDSVAVANLPNYTIVDRARLPFGSRPSDVAVDRDGRFLFVACEQTNELVVFETLSLARVATFDAGRKPIRVEADPAGGRVYVLSALGRELRVFDASGPRLVTRVPLESDPTAVAFTGEGARYLVALKTGNSILSFDRRTNEASGSAIVGGGAVDMIGDPFSDRVYVLQQNPPRLVYLNAATLAITRSFPLASPPRRIAIDPDSANLYVTLRDRNEILVVDRASGQSMGSFPSGGVAADIVATP